MMTSVYVREYTLMVYEDEAIDHGEVLDALTEIVDPCTPDEPSTCRLVYASTRVQDAVDEDSIELVGRVDGRPLRQLWHFLLGRPGKARY
jgi:hypothetical protein